jgi:hypothetical protein
VLIQTHCFSLLHTGESNWSFFKQACFFHWRLQAESRSIDLLIVHLVHILLHTVSTSASKVWTQAYFVWSTLLMTMDQSVDTGLLTHCWGERIGTNTCRRLAAVRLHTGEANRIEVLMQCSLRFPCAYAPRRGDK